MNGIFQLQPGVKVGDTLVDMMEVAQYENGRIAVQLWAANEETEGSFEPWDDLSVNLPDMMLPDNGKEIFFAKDYSYHKATFDAMLEAGYIEIVPDIIGNVGMHGTCQAARLTAKATEHKHN